jgi:hypothetical protein
MGPTGTGAQSMRHKRPYNRADRSHNRYTPEELDHEYHPTAEISGFRTGRPGARGSRLRRSRADIEHSRPGTARLDGSAGDTRHHSSASSAASASSASSAASAASASRRPHRGACASSPLRDACSRSSHRGPACASCRTDPPSSAGPCSRYCTGRRWGRRPGQQRCPERRRWQRLTAAEPSALCDRTTRPQDPGNNAGVSARWGAGPPQAARGRPGAGRSPGPDLHLLPPLAGKRRAGGANAAAARRVPKPPTAQRSSELATPPRWHS